MKQAEIIKHMKNGARLNIWLEGIKYKGTLTKDNGDIMPEVLGSLTDRQIDALLKYDFIALLKTVFTDDGYIMQYYKYEEEN